MQLLKHFHELSLHPNNAKELKGLILQLAVQGKLTAQWRKVHTDVEPAAKLLGSRVIEHEKHLYELDDSWHWFNLSVMCNIQTGRKDANEGNVNGKYNFYTCAKEPIKSSVYSFEGESILLPGNGANVGFVNYVNEKFEAYQRTYVLNNFVNVYPLYVFNALRALWKSNLGKQYGSAINYIKLGNLSNFKIPLPPLEEQKAIVEVVEQLFAEVEQLEQLTRERIQLKEQFAVSALHDLTTNNTPQEWEALMPHFHTFFTEETNIKKLREAILQLAVQGKLTANWRKSNPDIEPAIKLLQRIREEKARLIKAGQIKKENPLPAITEDEIPYELPEGWVWCRMQDLCPNISSGSTPPKEYFSENGIPYLKVYNIREQKIDFTYRAQFVDEKYNATKLKRSILNPGDVIMNIVGPPLGKIAIIPDDYPEWNCNQAITFFKPVDKRLKDWLYTFLCAGTFMKEIELIGTAGQDNISVTKSKNILIPLPPLEEQKAIVETVNRLMALCDGLEQELRQSKEQVEKWMKGSLREVFVYKK